MSDTTSQSGRPATLARVLRPGSSWIATAVEVGLILRILAADAVEWHVQRSGRAGVCVFPDADYYWKLAQTIRRGELYQIVEWGDIPRFALRTPGYPLFLAGCQFVAGDNPLAARLAQAALGSLTVWLVYRLTRSIVGSDSKVPAIAAGLTAVHPYMILMSAVLLSEAVFVPLMLASLWGMAVLWDRETGGRAAAATALGVGCASGAAVLTRPSWLLFVPAMLVAWAACRLVGRRPIGPAVRGAALAAAGFAAVMAPWWYRNATIYGEFVPTALWMGASLYDGLNPKANGASDMRFLADPDVWPMDERDQDAELARRAKAFVRAEPGKALRLAAVKLARYWSPWPNADVARSPLATIAGAVVMGPVLGLIAVGLWALRADPRAWVLLAGPILYFCALHMVFASSMRYRTPGEVPAMGLAAVGLARIAAARPPRLTTVA
jgi:4-amino-4-deoxy-L-arabinose transferase-like glycosyltransferase